MYCWDAQFTQEETEARRNRKTCPKSPTAVVLFTSMSGPVGKRSLYVSDAKAYAFQFRSLSCNNHAGKCLFHPKATNDTTLFFFYSNLSLQGSRIVNVCYPLRKNYASSS